ncbi:Helix-turn-helix domain-containing protein, partial [Dysosmobacter welbionis]
EALRAELGEDRLLYLMVEAPVWQGAAYNGYDYAALSEPADKLVVRVADYGDVSEDFPIAPLAPLEEVYYALAELADQVDSDCLSL